MGSFFLTRCFWREIQLPSQIPSSARLRRRASVPEAWAGSRVDLLWDSASEATLWLGGD